MKKPLAVALAVTLLVVGFAVFRLVNAAGNTFAATPNPEERLEAALAANKPVFIEFYADWCPSCVSMIPVITELKKKYGKEIEFILADVDNEGLAMAIEYQVMYIPAFVFINGQGERVGGELSGYLPKAQLEEMLRALL